MTMPLDQRKLPCLLLHGLTAAPAQWCYQEAALLAAGHRVSVPVLAGHCATAEALDTVRWQDWYADVLRALGEQTGPVNLAGLSLGGLLALHLAIERPDLVRRLVIVGVPLALPLWVETLYRLIRYTPLQMFVRQWPKNYCTTVADPGGRAFYQSIGYSVFPLAAATELKRLQVQVLDNLHRLRVPVTMVHARRDDTALPASVARLRERVHVPVTEYWLDYSYHVSTLDYDRDWISDLLVREFA